jgi:hypothetical protein
MEVAMFSTEGGFEMRGLRPAGLAIVSFSLLFAACGRSRELAVPERAERSAASSSPYVTDVAEIKVEYRPVAIPARMAVNSRADVQFEAKNTGAKTWPRGGDFPVVFGYHWVSPTANGEWETVLWDDSNRGVLKADTKPEEAVIVTMPVRALPRACPNCKLVIAPLLEMKAWSETAHYVAPVNIS